MWRYTAAHTAAAHRFVRRFAEWREAGLPDQTHDGRPSDTSSVCPECGAPLPADDVECPACAARAEVDAGRSLLRLTRFARSRLGMIALGFALSVAATAAGLVPPYLTMPLLDNVLIPFQAGEPANLGLIPWYLAGLAGAAIAAWLLSWGRTYVLAWVSERIAADLRNHTYAHLQRLSLEFFGGKRTGDLIARVSSDTERICYFLSVHLLDFASDALMMAMTAVILFTIDPWLALVTLGPLPLLAWLVQRVRNTLRGAFATCSRAWGDMTSVLADTIPGIRVVKAFAQERREVERFRAANDHVLAAADRVNRTWSFFSPVVVLLTDVGVLLVWLFGAWMVIRQELLVGMLTAFVLYIGRFYSRLDSMSRMAAAVQRAAASAHRIFEIIDQVPRVPEPVRPVKLAQVDGRVEFRDVWFRYGTRPVIRGMDLAIEPGEMIGLVGPSGGGKTTLVNLVCRFYDVTDGAILVDGTDIRRRSLEDHRRNIGIVLQEPFLFYGTIAENIAYGRPDASPAQVIEAARAARAHDFILKLPNGYDSLVGERGQSLSGGERQRISIARALLIDPKILILDEATSSVDTETEREIQLALENLVRGRTTIAIAHRLSTLQRADRLIVIEHGRIAETGAHAELVRAEGVYARLHQAQMRALEAQAV
jgi:ATP-binding cassette, subfamily B, bacterial